jgi:hypothetical protein
MAACAILILFTLFFAAGDYINTYISIMLTILMSETLPFIVKDLLWTYKKPDVLLLIPESVSVWYLYLNKFFWIHCTLKLKLKGNVHNSLLPKSFQKTLKSQRYNQNTFSVKNLFNGA